MHEHRLVAPISLEIYSFDSEFSSFRFLEDHGFLSNSAIHRCFSLARAIQASQKSIILENLSPDGEGIIRDENIAIRKVFPDYSCNVMYRISFWRKEIVISEFNRLSSKDLIGYLIIKHDHILSLNVDSVHVFEAVFPKYDHPHNCSHGEKTYQVRIGENIFEAHGVIFCQQNSIFKCCAHVALFSILSLFENDKEISFTKMNEIAGIVPPNTGLCAKAVRDILNYYNINYFDIDYDEANPEAKTEIPFQKLAYAGIESGGGALIGFSLEQCGSMPPDRHMIPFFGHTFNKDTWVPHAEASYFHFSSNLAYIPSDSWTSSFIGHDDNFGANFCIPKLYIQNQNVNYVAEIFRSGVKYSGLVAEIYALQFLYSVIDNIENAYSDFWITQLKRAVVEKKVTIRAIALQKDEYFNSLKSVDGFIDYSLIDTFAKEWPNVFWVAEISLPQLFPTNEAKLGEIIMDATVIPTDASQYNNFLAARLPGLWFFCEAENTTPKFFSLQSSIKSYIPNFTSFSAL